MSVRGVAGSAVQDEKLFRAKISDFGLSAHMTAGQTHVNISQGTEAYLPKEVFQNLAVTEASDIYAMGLLMWEIFYGIFWFIVWDTEKRRKKYAPAPIHRFQQLWWQLCCCMYRGCQMHIRLPAPRLVSGPAATALVTRILWGQQGVLLRFLCSCSYTYFALQPSGP